MHIRSNAMGKNVSKAAKKASIKASEAKAGKPPKSPAKPPKSNGKEKPKGEAKKGKPKPVKPVNHEHTVKAGKLKIDVVAKGSEQWGGKGQQRFASVRILGYSLARIVMSMGKAGWDASPAHAFITSARGLNLPEVKISSVRTWIQRGRAAEKDQAPLSKEQIKGMESLALAAGIEV